MYFLTYRRTKIGLMLFTAIIICRSVVKCEKDLLSRESLINVAKTSGQLGKHFEWSREVLCNVTTSSLHPARAELLGGLSHLLSACGLSAACYGSRLLTALDRALDSDTLRLADGGSLGGLSHLLSACGLSAACYGSRLLTALDRALDSDTLRLADGVYLVKEDRYEQRLESGVPGSEPFLTAFIRRLIMILETHALRVRLGVMKENVSQMRGLHRTYKHAFPLMVGSFMLLAAITVPMGFQFLAIVGGKALILSQIALYLALGGHIQRYFGGVAAAARPPVGGFVQHDYYIRNDSPWQRDDVGVLHHHHQPVQNQAHISHQQLQGYMNQRA